MCSGRESCFIHDDHVVETLAPNRADHPLRVCVLPRGTRGGAQLLDAHATRRRRQRIKRVIAIVNGVTRDRVLRKGLAELLGGPEGGRMRGDRDVKRRCDADGPG